MLRLSQLHITNCAFFVVGRYSSSDRKCEKQFNEYIKIRIEQAKSAFKQLLMETKMITDKSLQMVRDKETGHLQEIEELLKMDKRYLDLEGE